MVFEEELLAGNMPDGVFDLLFINAIIGVGPHQKPMEYDTHGPVLALLVVVAIEALRRPIVDLLHYFIALNLLSLLTERGKAEALEFNEVFVLFLAWCNENILWPEITVNDALGVTLTHCSD